MAGSLPASLWGSPSEQQGKDHARWIQLFLISLFNISKRVPVFSPVQRYWRTGLLALWKWRLFYIPFSSHFWTGFCKNAGGVSLSFHICALLCGALLLSYFWMWNGHRPAVLYPWNNDLVCSSETLRCFPNIYHKWVNPLAFDKHISHFVQIDIILIYHFQIYSGGKLAWLEKKEGEEEKEEHTGFSKILSDLLGIFQDWNFHTEFSKILSDPGPGQAKALFRSRPVSDMDQ